MWSLAIKLNSVDSRPQGTHVSYIPHYFFVELINLIEKGLSFCQLICSLIEKGGQQPSLHCNWNVKSAYPEILNYQNKFFRHVISRKIADNFSLARYLFCFNSSTAFNYPRVILISKNGVEYCSTRQLLLCLEIRHFSGIARLEVGLHGRAAYCYSYSLLYLLFVILHRTIIKFKPRKWDFYEWMVNRLEAFAFPDLRNITNSNGVIE